MSVRQYKKIIIERCVIVFSTPCVVGLVANDMTRPGYDSLAGCAANTRGTSEIGHRYLGSDCFQVLGIEEVLTAYRSPWQNPYAERIIGSMRRECLDHIIVLGPKHWQRVLTQYVDYYNGVRTHLSLRKNSPEWRPIQFSSEGRIIELRRLALPAPLYPDHKWPEESSTASAM